jgi:hypothetical protein
MDGKKRTREKPLTFADVRRLALAMPEVTEVKAYGMSAFKAGKKRFAGQPIERPDVEPSTIGVGVSLEQRERLLAARPDLYYLTDHYVSYPTVLVRFSRMTRDELRELLATAWSRAMQGAGPGKAPTRTSRQRKRTT